MIYIDWLTLIYNSLIMSQQKQSKINCEEVLNSFCGVCFSSFRKKPPKKLDEGLDALICSKCKCMTHQCCYGFEINTKFLGDGVKEFTCERCLKTDLRKKSCMICNGKEGVMKAMGDEVIHVFCGLVHSQIDVIEYYPEIKFQKTLLYEENKMVCQICKTNNANDHCTEESCQRKVHTYCAKMEHRINQDEENDKCWKFMIICGDNNKMDLHQEVASIEWVIEENDKVLKNFETYEVWRPSKEQIRNKVYQEYKEEAIAKKKNSKKLKRGGFIFVACSQHGAEQYCRCFGASQGGMVFCECCFNWYHYTCVDFNPKNPTEDYICKECVDFYELKKKIVDEVRFKKTDNYEIKNEFPHKMSIMELMWLMRVIDQRVGGGSTKMGKLIKQLPMKSSKMSMLVKNQNRNKICWMSQNIVLEYLTLQAEKLNSLQVLSLDEQYRPVILSQNIESNLRLKQYVTFASAFAKSNRFPDLYSKLQASLQMREKFLTDDYDTILAFSKLDSEMYPQVKVLKVKAEAYSFMETLRKAKTGQTIQFQHLQQALQKAKQANNVPMYLLNPLIDTYSQSHNLVMEIIKQLKQWPQNLNSINQQLQQLGNLKVSPPPHYQAYKNELKLINDLYLLYLKSSASPLLPLSVLQKIKQLLNQTHIQASKQLVDLIQGFPKLSIKVIDQIDSILDKYTQLCIQYELKSALNIKSIHSDRLQQLVKLSKPQFITKYSPSVKNLLELWSNLFNKSQNVLEQDLSEVNDITSIQTHSDKVKQAIKDFQQLPFTLITKDSSNNILSRLNHRKEELNQLKILFTEAQLHKNPLTLQKISSTLPKNNLLIKNYFNLRKEQDQLKDKYNKIITKIQQKIQNLKTETKKLRKDQIKDNSQKPTISDINEFIQLLNNSPIEFQSQISHLTEMINQTILIASEVKKYCSKETTFETATLEDLKKAKDQIDELRKKVMLISQLNLKSELVSLYHLQICYRMRMMLLTPTSDLQKVNKVLRYAEEEQLIYINSYKQLKNTYEQKNQSKEEITFIRSIDQILTDQAQKNSDGLYGNVQNARKTLPIKDYPVQKDLGSYIEGLIEKNKWVRKRIDQIMKNGSSKCDFNDAKAVLLQGLKNPYTIPKLPALTHQLQKFNKLLQKWKQSPKPSNSQALYFIEYDDMIFYNDEIEQFRNCLKVTEETLQQFDSIRKREPSIQNCYEIQEIMENLEQQNILADTPTLETVKIKYLEYWVILIKQYSETKQGKIPYNKMKRLLVQAYTLLQAILRKNGNPQVLRNSIEALEGFMEIVLDEFKIHQNSEQPLIEVDNFIDVQDLYYEVQGTNNIQDEINLMYPFNELAKFKYINIQSHKAPKEELFGAKRSRNEEDFRKQEKQEEDESVSMKNQQEPQLVTEVQRKLIKEFLLKKINKNPQFKDCQEYVKMIENQIFGEWHNNLKTYLIVGDKFETLFKQLLKAPKISAKVAKKKFQFGFLKLLLESLTKIPELQAMMVSKSKEEEKGKEKTKEKTQQIKLVVPETTVAQQKNKNILDMLASGKVNESQKQDLRKQIKAVKSGSKNHKDYKEKESSKHSKKKKHHKKKSKSRSRSRSGSRSLQKDAKFSSQDQKALPSYIQKEYNTVGGDIELPPVNLNISKSWEPSIYGVQKAYEDPLMFDPQANIEDQKTVWYQKGSVLKLKDVEIQLVLKKNKYQFGGKLLTDQDHHKVLSQLVDPQFSRISIRRQKNDQEIIQYLNKPSKKKYKYLVGWIQAHTPLHNEYLRDFAIQTQQNNKIFGLQNPHIKMHIMSIRQLLLVNRLHHPPNRATSQSAANILRQDRLVFILQYPAEKMYELKGIYPNFTNIQKIDQTYQLLIPTLIPDLEQFRSSYPLKTSNPISVSIPIPQKDIEYEGWGNQPIQQPQQHYQPPNFQHPTFSPITTEEEDNGKEDEKDYTNYLLNSISDSNLKTVSQSLNQPGIQPIHDQGYNNYRYIQPDRWTGYNHQNPPYNPMSMPKFNPPPSNPINMMYKNPMAFVPQPTIRDNRIQPQQHYDRRMQPPHFQGNRPQQQQQSNYDLKGLPPVYDRNPAPPPPPYFHEQNKY